MNTTIYIDQFENSAILEDIGNKRELRVVKTTKEAFLFHIENSDVDSYIISPNDKSVEELQTMIDHIHYLNALITIFIFKPDPSIRNYFSDKQHIHVVDKETEIIKTLEKLQPIQRDTNRVQWPLKVQYWKQDDPGMVKHWGIVLSLSSSGCFISTERKLVLEKNDPVAMTFHFKDFDFYSEGSIVRIKIRGGVRIEGIAIGFHDVSPQTKNCIQEIINEKLLGELMETLKPDYDKY